MDTILLKETSIKTLTYDNMEHDSKEDALKHLKQLQLKHFIEDLYEEDEYHQHQGFHNVTQFLEYLFNDKNNLEKIKRYVNRKEPLLFFVNTENWEYVIKREMSEDPLSRSDFYLLKKMLKIIETKYIEQMGYICTEKNKVIKKMLVLILAMSPKQTGYWGELFHFFMEMDRMTK